MANYKTDPQTGARFDLSEEDGILVVAITGEPSAEGIIEILHQTQGNTGFTHSARLWDFRKAVFNLSNDDLRKVAGIATRGEGSAGRLALLVSIDLSFGVSRIYETYRKSEKTSVKVFREKQEAVQWLKS